MNICLWCHKTVVQARILKIERHYFYIHKEFDNEYLLNSTKHNKELSKRLVAQKYSKNAFCVQCLKLKIYFFPAQKIVHILANKMRPWY